ncbi:unnamed protein product [Thelazia callipaeda]|uniref:L51_S25_CI-B8 domain-containing protein n=1 Tax=Thelazia callipaeda TaxID=103827 RepID=A0A0N5D1Y4_THECL|nr:unnamed protein product [Thelazia callipaeda]
MRVIGFAFNNVKVCRLVAAVSQPLQESCLPRDCAKLSLSQLTDRTVCQHYWSLRRKLNILIACRHHQPHTSTSSTSDINNIAAISNSYLQFSTASKSNNVVRKALLKPVLWSMRTRSYSIAPITVSNLGNHIVHVISRFINFSSTSRIESREDIELEYIASYVKLYPTAENLSFTIFQLQQTFYSFPLLNVNHVLKSKLNLSLCNPFVAVSAFRHPNKQYLEILFISRNIISDLLFYYRFLPHNSNICFNYNTSVAATTTTSNVLSTNIITSVTNLRTRLLQKPLNYQQIAKMSVQYKLNFVSQEKADADNVKIFRLCGNNILVKEVMESKDDNTKTVVISCLSPNTNADITISNGNGNLNETGKSQVTEINTQGGDTEKYELNENDASVAASVKLTLSDECIDKVDLGHISQLHNNIAELGFIICVSY